MDGWEGCASAVKIGGINPSAADRVKILDCGMYRRKPIRFNPMFGAAKARVVQREDLSVSPSSGSDSPNHAKE